MTRFLGEYDCKIDAKGRIMLPAGLKKQLPDNAPDKFVINRGFETHLVLYPIQEWEIITAEINNLNLYNKKNRDFVHYFYRGATEVELDGSNRLLIPKRLQEYAAIDTDVVLFAYHNRIEVWAKKLYDKFIDDEPKDFSDLAEEVMGKQNQKEI